MTDILGQIRKLNRLGDCPIAEPFAGGAGASLTLLYLEETPEIFINDADSTIYDFWWAVTSRPQQFGELISKTRVSIAEWRRQREVFKRHGRVSRLKRGFSTFYLNRCNRSGIIMNGGPIGGIEQTGKWKIGARFNKLELRRRCDKISEFRSRIHVTNRDGIEFLESEKSGRIFYFVDPPYFHKGKTLYLNTLDEKYHQKLSCRLKSMADAAWILTYDDCPEIRRMYRGWATIRPFKLGYGAYERRSGNEILIAPKWMQLPTAQSSAAIVW